MGKVWMNSKVQVRKWLQFSSVQSLSLFFFFLGKMIYFFIFFILYLTLHNCISFAKYQNESTTGRFRMGNTCMPVTQSYPTLCDPMNCSTPGLLVHHQLPESTQIHVHRVDDAIQPSHPRPVCPPASNPSPHQGLFQ